MPFLVAAIVSPPVAAMVPVLRFSDFVKPVSVTYPTAVKATSRAVVASVGRAVPRGATEIPPVTSGLPTTTLLIELAMRQTPFKVFCGPSKNWLDGYCGATCADLKTHRE